VENGRFHTGSRTDDERINPMPKNKGPTLEPLNQFHVDPKGYIHFQRRPLAGSSIELDEEANRHLAVSAAGYTGSFPVSMLERIQHWLPELREQFYEQLTRDAYASINTVHTPKPWPGTDDYRRINAVWVDCDCEDLDYFEAVERVYAMQARNTLPPISVIANTGRGIHVYWLLTGGEDDPKLPPKGWAKTRFPMEQINEALASRVEQSFPELAPDKAAIHITTHMRIAGSVNTKTGAEVAYTINLDSDDNPPRYTLDYLTEFLGVKPYPTRYKRTRTTPEKKQPQRRVGWVRRYESRLEDFAIIRTYMKSHGGFPKTTRRWAVLYQTNFMEPCGYTKHEMEQEALRLASECNPPLPAHEARAQFKSALPKKGKSGKKKRRKPQSDMKIANKLGVTVELAEQLGLKFLRPDSRPYTGTGKQKGIREKRLEFLANLAEKHGGNPLPFTYAELEGRMKAAGLKAARGTIQNDLDRLGLYVKNSQKARQKDREDTPQNHTLPLVN